MLKIIAIVSFLAALSPTPCLAQSYLPFIQDRVHELKKTGVDTILYYEECTSYIPYRDFNTEGPEYLVWIKNDSMYIEKLALKYVDTVLSSGPIHFHDTTLFSIMKAELDKLASDRIRPRVVHYKSDSVDVFIPISHTHECIKFFILFVGSEKAIKELNQSDMFDEIPRYNLPNINFKYNQQLSVTRFQVNLDRLIAVLSANKRFVLKQRRQ